MCGINMHPASNALVPAAPPRAAHAARSARHARDLAAPPRALHAARASHDAGGQISRICSSTHKQRGAGAAIIPAGKAGNVPFARPPQGPFCTAPAAAARTRVRCCSSVSSSDSRSGDKEICLYPPSYFAFFLHGHGADWQRQDEGRCRNGQW